MTKLATLLAGVMLMVVMTAGSVWALPELQSGFNWINAPFWTNTDTTTPPANGNSQFALTFEQASYESDFGLFSIKGTTANPVEVDNKFQIFAYSQEPASNPYSGSATRQTVYFRNDGSISLDGVNFTEFSKEFGFYFDVHTGGANDPTADYFYYSYNPFNQPQSESGIDHVLTAYNSATHEVLIFLDDQLIASGSDSDFNDMVVYGNDLTPVPEPSTLLLLGAGLLGLGFYGRRRMKV